jgi:hypothetical protein
MFLESQRCAWISRAYRIQNDNWRYDLKNLAPGNNLLCIRPCDVDENLHPILFDLVVDYTKFYGKFSEINGNYKQAYIFDNKSFKLGPDFTGTIKQYSFGRNFYTLHKNNFRKLKFTDCFHEGRFKTVAEFAADGLPLLPAAWMLLRSSLLRAKALLTKNDRFLDNKCTSIENFMGAPIKGSKRFRNILSTEINANIPVIRSVYTFATLVNLPVPEPQILKKIYQSWYHTCLGNKVREFIFKFRYNYLGLNNRLNAFIHDADPRCTFCRIRDNDTVIRDSLAHFFMNCATSSNLITQVRQKYFRNKINDEDFAKLYWYGTGTGTDTVHQSINLIVWDLFRFVLYQFKQRRTVPNFLTFDKEFLFYIGIILTSNAHFKEKIRHFRLYENLLQALG